MKYLSLCYVKELHATLEPQNIEHRILNYERFDQFVLCKRTVHFVRTAEYRWSPAFVGDTQ